MKQLIASNITATNPLLTGYDPQTTVAHMVYHMDPLSFVKKSRWRGYQDDTRIQNQSAFYYCQLFAVNMLDIIGLFISSDTLFLCLWDKDRNLQNLPVYKHILNSSSLSEENPIATLEKVEDSRFESAFIDTYGEALRQMDKLTELDSGWDSYDASKVDPEAIEAAMEVLLLLYKRGISKNPITGPTPSGGITFQWRVRGVEVYAEITKGLNEFYIAREDENDVIKEGEFDTPKALADELAEVLS